MPRNKWKPEQDAILIEMYDAGASDTKIADRIGLSVNAIRGRTHFLKLPRRETARALSKWTPEREAQVVQLFKERKTIDEVAFIMGVSYAAIAGLRHRLGLARPSQVGVDIKVLPDSSNLGAETPSNEDLCQYPFGEPTDKDFHYCGQPVVKDRPYCDKHCRICYTSYKPADELTL